jgi:signal transduction histidine kinase
LDEVATRFFPLPHVFKGERRTGVLVDWPAICDRCDRQCETSSLRGLQLCSYGLNYLRIDDDLLVAGIAVRDFPVNSPARRTRLREVGRDVVMKRDLERIVNAAELATTEEAAEVRARMDEAVREFRESKTYQQEMVELLRPDLERALSQIHDYKQFVQQIVQNMNVILETRFPGLELEEKLRRATHEETALYWAAALMDEKLDAALFLEAPERILEPREQGRFRLHGLVTKYVRIYKSRADQKRLSVRIVGDSWANIEGNARALGIIPHTMIDNAIKYAPAGSRVFVTFRESGNTVSLAVESFGPKIEASEAARIFDLFYRSEAARQMSSEGTGFGLASAQNVAKAHDTEIIVQQTDRKGPEDTLETVFSIDFPIVDRGEAL